MALVDYPWAEESVATNESEKLILELLHCRGPAKPFGGANPARSGTDPSRFQ
jgi:hypothetical protein